MNDGVREIWIKKYFSTKKERKKEGNWVSQKKKERKKERIKL